LLCARDLPFNRQGPAVAYVIEGPQEGREVYLSLADRNFPAQRTPVGRVDAVFDVYPADIRPKHLDRIDRIPFTVHNQIGRVQVDAHVSGSNIKDRAQQRDRSLLSGFKEKLLTISLAVLAQVLQYQDQLGVDGIV